MVALEAGPASHPKLLSIAGVDPSRLLALWNLTRSGRSDAAESFEKFCGLFYGVRPTYMPSMIALYLTLMMFRLTFMVGVSSPPSTLSRCGSTSNFLIVW